MASTEDYRVSATACVKMVMHAAKYPAGEVSGVIVGQANTSQQVGTQPIVVEDVVPLFHKAENVTSPLLEIALAQIESYASTRGSKIVGYYQANERGDDRELHSSTKRIGDIIRERSSQQACILLLDNEKFTSLLSGESRDMPFRLFVRKGGQWSAEPSKLVFDAAPEIIQQIAEGKQAKLVDFSEHICDISKDWRNAELF